MTSTANLLDVVAELATRRGLLLPSSEIYGGLRASWDWGPLGVELKRNLKAAWWHRTVQTRGDVVGLDAAILMAPRVWEASGHVRASTEVVVECTNCSARFPYEQLAREAPAPGVLECPSCRGRSFRDPRNVSLMFKTFLGPAEDAAAALWLRTETGQSGLIDYPAVQAASRRKLPFGIAQIGKVFRNEIETSALVFRTHEFEQMELEFFVEPGTDERWHEDWVRERLGWHHDLGLRPESLRLREHGYDEHTVHAKRAVDIEYLFPFGWAKLETVANRADFGLAQHQRHSGRDLSYYDQERDARYIPYVIEPSLGADRCVLAFLLDAYHAEEAPTAAGGTEKRVVLRLDPRLAPMKAAVLPLSRKEPLLQLARQLTAELRERWMADYDDAGSIGRRYRRQDEVGTPYCVTVDFESGTDRAVTVRERDSMAQDRVGVDRLTAYLDERLPR
jgi:glycyl-tRNA synthetase